MAVPWGLLLFPAGIAYGWMHARRHAGAGAYRGALLWGLAAAAILSLAGFLLNSNPLGLENTGFVLLTISAFVLTVVFLVGTWIGDLFTGAKHAPRASRASRRH